MKAESYSYHLYKERINKALDFINDHISEKIHLADVARSAFFSPYHFHRIFTSLMEETPDDYIRRLRLEKAAKLIRSRRDLDLTTIAYNCGFSSSALFSKNFKKHFNITPFEWKNSKNKQMKNKNKKEKAPENHYNPYRIYKGEIMVDVLKMAAFKVAFMRHLSGYNKETEKTFKKLLTWASAQDLITPSTKIISIILDSPSITPEDKCRLYACISINQPIEATGVVDIMEIPEGRYAKIKYVGKRETIDSFYTKFFREWLPYSGFIPDDFPIYHVNIVRDNSKNSFEFDSYIKIKSL